MVDEVADKEIIIKFKTKKLKMITYITIIIVLVGVIIGQYAYFPNCKISNQEFDVVGAATDVVDVKSNVSLEINTSIGGESEEFTEEVVSNTTETNSTDSNSSEEVDDSVLLPITGKVLVSIDDIKIDPKPNIDDYAKVTSVSFTIKNQDKDFSPIVKAWLTYDIDDKKDIDYLELEAGKEFFRTESKLFFGFKEVDTDKTLKLEVWDSKKMIASTSKTFSVD